MRDAAFIVGNSIACLAAALSRADAGQPVTLLSDLRRAGGGFGGISISGRQFDLGLRLFELDYEAVERRPITDFQPDLDGHRPFIADIASFVRKVCGDELQPAPDPEMWIEGRRIRCPLMTVDLSGLVRVLSVADRETIMAQAQALPTPDHPGDESLRDASIARHGSRLHELLIAAICAKQWHRWPETMAAERRKLWAALFYPRTVCEAFGNGPITFKPHRPFSRLECGQAFPFVRRLVELVMASPLITVRSVSQATRISLEGRAIMFDFATGGRVELPVARTTIGLSPEQIFAAAGIPFEQERVISSIVWAEVPAASVQQKPSCLTIADPALAPFRLSYASSGVFCIEFGAKLPTPRDTRAALELTGCIAPGTAIHVIHQTTGPAQPAPTTANRERFNWALHRFHEAGFRCALIGGARRFGWGSLNDQIADGLYFGATGC